MKKLFLLGSFALAMSGCASVPGLTLFTTTLAITSDYTADITPNDGIVNEVPVICDDRTTIVNYSFSYSGDLASWTSELVGRQGEIKARRAFTPLDFTPVNGVVSVDYNIPSGQAPLSQPSNDNLSGQAIIVVPNAVVIGYSKVRVSVQNSRGDSTGSVSSNELPVVDNCPVRL